MTNAACMFRGAFGREPRDPETIDVGRLAGSLGAIGRVLRSLVADMADVAWLDVVTDLGLVRVSSAARDAAIARALDATAAVSVPGESQFRMKAVVAHETRDLADGARDHVDVLRALGAHSFLREPLVSSDHVVGALTVASLRPGVHFGQRDQSTMEIVARALGYLVGQNG